MSNISRINRKNATVATNSTVSAGLRKYLEASAIAQGDVSRVVFVCDMSGSMVAVDDARSGKSRVEYLREALAKLVMDLPSSRIVVFDYEARVACGPSDLGHAAGGTRLEKGLELAGRMKPAIIVVISDGQPASELMAEQEAARHPNAIIHCVYVGADSDATAVAFMQRLASRHGGKFSVKRLADKALSLYQVVKGLLPA